jgi:hypothetical protein
MEVIRLENLKGRARNRSRWPPKRRPRADVSWVAEMASHDNGATAIGLAIDVSASGRYCPTWWPTGGCSRAGRRCRTPATVTAAARRTGDRSAWAGSPPAARDRRGCAPRAAARPGWCPATGCRPWSAATRGASSWAPAPRRGVRLLAAGAGATEPQRPGAPPRTRCRFCLKLRQSQPKR